MDAPEGVISASLIILIVVACAIGAAVGLVLGDALTGTRTLAIIAGLIATVVASIARYKLIFLGAHRGTDEAKIPMVLVVNAAIASIAGSLAAHDGPSTVDRPGSIPLLRRRRMWVRSTTR